MALVTFEYLEGRKLSYNRTEIRLTFLNEYPEQCDWVVYLNIKLKVKNLNVKLAFMLFGVSFKNMNASEISSVSLLCHQQKDSLKLI